MLLVRDLFAEGEDGVGDVGSGRTVGAGTEVGMRDDAAALLPRRVAGGLLLFVGDAAKYLTNITEAMALR